MLLYIYDILHIYYSNLVGCLSFPVSIWTIYIISNVCPFDYTAFMVGGKICVPVNRFNHTSWVAFFTPTNRPKLVRNSCLMKICSCAFLLVVTFKKKFCWYRGFCRRTESYHFSFFIFICHLKSSGEFLIKQTLSNNPVQ